MVSTDPNDPNFGLETDQASPNFGLAVEEPKSEGGVVSNALAGAGDVIKGFAQQFIPKFDVGTLASLAYGPINAQIQGYHALKSIVDIPSQIAEAEKTEPFSRERFAAGFNVAGQLGLLAAGARAPKISEIAGLEKPVAPEAMPQTPEPLATETVPDLTETINQTGPQGFTATRPAWETPTAAETADSLTAQFEELQRQAADIQSRINAQRGGEINAEQIQGATRPDVNVQLPGGASAREVYGGEMPANVGGERVPTRGQGETLQQTPQEVAAPVPQPEQPTVSNMSSRDVESAVEDYLGKEGSPKEIGDWQEIRDDIASGLTRDQALRKYWSEKVALDEKTAAEDAVRNADFVQNDERARFAQMTPEQWREEGARRTYESLLPKFKPTKTQRKPPSFEQWFERTQTGLSDHEMAIQQATLHDAPVNAAAVEKYGIELPEGYEKQGDLYVKPTSQVPKGGTGIPSVGKPKQTEVEQLPQVGRPEEIAVPEAVAPTTAAPQEPSPQTPAVTEPTTAQPLPQEEVVPPPVETAAVSTSDNPPVSRFANRFVEERVKSGEIGEIAPGQGISTPELVQRGLQMPPERVNEAVSRLVQGGDIPVDDAAAIRGEEARLSQRSAELSKVADANPNDVNAKLAADNAFKDLTDFHNGPVAQLKQNWHQQGKLMQGEIPVDLSTTNGLREQWLRDVGEMPPSKMEPVFRQTAEKVSKSISEDNGSRANLRDAIDKATSKRKLPTVEEVQNNIMERMKVPPCPV